MSLVVPKNTWVETAVPEELRRAFYNLRAYRRGDLICHVNKPGYNKGRFSPWSISIAADSRLPAWKEVLDACNFFLPPKVQMVAYVQRDEPHQNTIHLVEDTQKKFRF